MPDRYIDSDPRRYPLISIVTPSYNQVDFIGEAIKSVQMQGYENYEHFIIDGASTDGTVDMLASFDGNGLKSSVKWLSERDNGQSSALNKGFALARGEIIGW